MAQVELRGLTKRYGAAVAAVDGISLTVRDGQMICLLGPSGCGKTTTLRLIAGFMEPTAGEILVGGIVLSSAGKTLPPEARNMSMIFQSYALWPHMTVAQNIAYGLELRRLDKVTIAAKLKEILTTTRLEALSARYPGELSGGQQQRVSLARALVVQPQTLLLDEPLSNLDANLREEMRFEIRRLHDTYRTTTVYVTHDQGEAMTTADQIAVMNGGRIEQLGTPEEIFERPRSQFVARFIGGSNIVSGVALDGSHIELAGARLRCTGNPLTQGAKVPVSIRQHAPRLHLTPAAQGQENVFPATVRRQVFLGAHRDAVAALADGTEIRVTAPSEPNIPAGTALWIELPAAQCRVLAE